MPPESTDAMPEIEAGPLQSPAISGSPERDEMATGTVNWFNPTRHYGFIQPEDGFNDVFVHVTAVEAAGQPFGVLA